MKYILTRRSYIDQYNVITLMVPPFSKLLNATVISREIIFVFESIENSQNGLNNSKTFNFKIVSGLEQYDTYIDERWNYFNTFRVQDGDIVDYYHLFYEEIKTLQETRDSKLEEIINHEQEF